MKQLFVILFVFLSACASKIALKETSGYAYIYTKQLEKTAACNGKSIKIVGVRQAGKKASFLSLHSIYVPEGENYIYYTPIFEDMSNGKCGVMQELVVRHSEVPISSMERRPMGIELRIEVKAGKSYTLKYAAESVELKEYVE